MAHNLTTDEPFEVRDAGTGRGLGCFATRDIKPGEVVLVDYTSIHWVNNIHCPDFVEEYRRGLRLGRPDGTYLEEEKQDEYLRLIQAADSNAYGTSKTTEDALFLRASRFNHSCDPNLSYEVFEGTYRWVGRASRHIAKGEEILVTYLANHSRREERAKLAREVWGFSCDCPKCNDGIDTYTASLIRARNAANAFEPEKTEPPPIFVDDLEAMAERLKFRTELLREIVGSQKHHHEDPSRRRELTFGLYDAAIFHRDYWGYWMGQDDNDDATDGGKARTQEAIKHIALDREYSSEAAFWAKTAWPDTDEMVHLLAKEARKVEKAWEELRESLGLGEDINLDQV
ncbi:hypothetical protein F5Y12DRAFT_720131 [Xylaria sp. FL1777]|nr:hypothetical protein F5Y12DRAFT_720131 [Xylaria sp. FL1777]